MLKRQSANFYFWYFAFLGVFGTYFALYLQAIGLSATQIAFLLSLQQVVRIVAPYFWGWLADRLHNRDAVIRATLLLASAVFVLLFFADDYGTLVPTFILMFAFLSAALPLFEANVLAIAEGDSGRYARIRLWGSVGFIAGVLTVGVALDHLPMRTLPWMTLGLLLAATGSAFAVAGQQSDAALSPRGESIWPILKRPAVVALFVACFLMMASQSASFVFYSIYMVEHGYSKAMVGLLWSVGVVAEIGIFLSLPWLNARYSAFELFSFSYAMTVLRFLLVGWFPEVTLLQVLAQSLHAFTFGTWHAAAMAMLHQLFPGRLSARGQALYTSFSFGIGGAVGAVCAGLAWQSIGPAWTFTLMSAFALAGWVVSARGLRDLESRPSAPQRET